MTQYEPHDEHGDEPPDATIGRTGRRDFLWRTGAGFTGLALASLLDRDGFFTRHAHAAPVPVHVPVRAKRCIFLFMFGGPSQVDLFDYKPELQRRDGQSIRLERRRGQPMTSTLVASRRSFARYGETGQWCSDVFPHLARHMDKLAVVKSLYTDSFAHGSAVLQMNTGKFIQGYPALGSWLSYGLGNGTDDLPAFVVMQDPRGGPISGPTNWSSGFIPAAHQGTLFRSGGDPVLDLRPSSTEAGGLGFDRTAQRAQIDALHALNERHAAERPGVTELAARIENYELAYRMQTSAPDALDLSTESEETRRLYALDAPKGPHRLSVGAAPFGRQCLVARRLLERGVRFVQIYHGGGHQQQTWDAHHGVEENLSIHGPEVDRPIAGLLTDLERRGMLDDTLVIWGGEFGRQPMAQNTIAPDGRDHNPKGFTMWLAGGGVKPGPYGATDEIGAEAVVDRHHVRDFHATILHLMGIDHTRLSYFYGGLDQRLTGPQEAEVIRGIVA